MEQAEIVQLATEPLDPQEVRIRNLEKRLAFMEQSFAELVKLVKRSETAIAQKMLGAMSGAFHQISDQLALTAKGPHPMQYVAVRVPEGTEKSIIAKRTGDHYDFSTSISPDRIENDNTEDLAVMFRVKELLQDGETGWFHISIGDQPEGAQHDGATVPAAQAS